MTASQHYNIASEITYDPPSQSGNAGDHYPRNPDDGLGPIDRIAEGFRHDCAVRSTVWVPDSMLAPVALPDAHLFGTDMIRRRR